MEIFELKTRLSNNLKKLRKEKSWSQFELAEHADISEQTINSIESKRLWPSEKTITKIINALDVDVCKLFLPEKEIGIPKDEISEELKNVVIHSIHNLIEETFQNYFN